ALARGEVERLAGAAPRAGGVARLLVELVRLREVLLAGDAVAQVLGDVRARDAGAELAAALVLLERLHGVGLDALAGVIRVADRVAAVAVVVLACAVGVAERGGVVLLLARDLG